MPQIYLEPSKWCVCVCACMGITCRTVKLTKEQEQSECGDSQIYSCTKNTQFIQAARIFSDCIFWNTTKLRCSPHPATPPPLACKISQLHETRAEKHHQPTCQQLFDIFYVMFFLLIKTSLFFQFRISQVEDVHSHLSVSP